MQLKLSTRLITGVVLIHTIMLGILVWNSGRQISNSHLQLLHAYADEKTTLIATTLAPALATNDRNIIIETLKQLGKDSSLTNIMVFNYSNKLLASINEQNSPSEFSDIKVNRTIYLADQAIGNIHAEYSTARIEHITKKTRLQNSIIALLAISLTSIFIVMLGLYLTRGFRRLVEGAHALRSGNLSHRIDIKTHDEIANVAHSLNKMAQHLEETQATLTQQHSALAREKQRMETLLNNINAVVFEANIEERQFLYVSQEAENLLGYPRTEWLIPEFWQSHLHPDDCNWSNYVINEQAVTGGDFSMDFRMLHANGYYLWIRSIHSIETSTGNKVGRGLLINIDEQKKTEERITYLANHDALTSLFNRHRFHEELTQQIAYARRFNQQCALLFIDLDQFKYINDTLGHQAGDECLLTVAQSLSTSLRSIDILGRLGGDEFGAILPNTSAENAKIVAQHLLYKLEHEMVPPLELSTHISASIGISISPIHGTTPNELLAKADAAMYMAKRQGRNQYHLYLPDDDTLTKMQAKVHWEDKIQRALTEDRFLILFQPIYNIRNHEVLHYEVLLRLQDSDGSLIYPNAFLDTAEHFGLIRAIDKWVMRKAIQAQGDSIVAGQPVNLAINISGRNFGDAELLQVLNDALIEFKADPHALIFEVTETAAVDNFARARRFIESLRQIGCRFALDDFGVGYSSFHYLRNLPVDMIKIDGSFIRNLNNNQFDQIIVKAISDVAHGLAITTIAESVENNDVKQLLLQLGVEYGQGYHLAMPEETHQLETELS